MSPADSLWGPAHSSDNTHTQAFRLHGLCVKVFGTCKSVQLNVCLCASVFVCVYALSCRGQDVGLDVIFRLP